MNNINPFFSLKGLKWAIVYLINVTYNSFVLFMFWDLSTINKYKTVHLKRAASLNTQIVISVDRLETKQVFHDLYFSNQLM